MDFQFQLFTTQANQSINGNYAILLLFSFLSPPSSFAFVRCPQENNKLYLFFIKNVRHCVRTKNQSAIYNIDTIQYTSQELFIDFPSCPLASAACLERINMHSSHLPLSNKKIYKYNWTQYFLNGLIHKSTGNNWWKRCMHGLCVSSESLVWMPSFAHKCIQSKCIESCHTHPHTLLPLLLISREWFTYSVIQQFWFH